MNTATAQAQNTHTATLHRAHLIVNGNNHRPDLAFANLPVASGAPQLCEAMLPQIRTIATLIAAKRHHNQTHSPAQFTEEADWFAARILALEIRRVHLDITLMPMLNIANQRAQAFALAHSLPFMPAEIRMSLHAGRPAALLIIETEQAYKNHGNLIANSLAAAKALKARLPQLS